MISSFSRKPTNLSFRGLHKFYLLQDNAKQNESHNTYQITRFNKCDIDSYKFATYYVNL